MNVSLEIFPIVLSIAAFVSVALMILGISQHMEQRAKKRELLKRVQKESLAYGVGDLEIAFSVFDYLKAFFAKLFSSLGKNIVDEDSGDFSQMRLKLIRAGIRSRSFPTAIWGIKGVITVLFPVLFVVLSKLPGFPVLAKQVFIFGCVAFALSGFYLPGIVVHILCEKRRETLLKGFPDALDLLVVCVESGMGLDAAFSRVSKEIALGNKALSEELGIYLMELNAGKLRKDALRGLSMRVNIDDVSRLVTLIIQADKFGTSVSKSLRIYSENFRTKRMQIAEEKAAKLGVKMLIPLIIFIFPALMVVVMGPAFIKLFEMM